MEVGWAEMEVDVEEMEVAWAEMKVEWAEMEADVEEKEVGRAEMEAGGTETQTVSDLEEVVQWTGENKGAEERAALAGIKTRVRCTADGISRNRA